MLTVTVGRTTYQVEAPQEGLHIGALVGPRGGRTMLVQNAKNPAAWCALFDGGKRPTWFLQTVTGLVQEVR